MNPIIANERNKKKCQKFTPLNKVDDMLDLAGYSRDLFGKKVLEYSFGSGNIIKQIVKRYVEDALTQNIDVNNISSGLSADIYGIELDPQLYDQCISDLNEIVRSYGISTVNWSFVCTDALQWTTDIKFDFIRIICISFTKSIWRNTCCFRERYWDVSTCSCYRIISLG